MKIRIIDSGQRSAKDVMQKDTLLLKDLQEKEVILHLYEWKQPRTLTYGCFMKLEKFFSVDQLALCTDYAVRPTGGGFTFHHGDYAFSVLMSAKHPLYHSSVLENYHTVNGLVIKVLQEVFSLQGTLSIDEAVVMHSCNEHFCSAKVSKYDVMIGKRKVGGAAQRSLPQGFLHQGSIFLSKGDDSLYREILLPDIANIILDDIRQNSFFPLDVCADSHELGDARHQVKCQLIKIFSCGDL